MVADYREASFRPSARFPAFISARADLHVSKFSGTGLAAFVSSRILLVILPKVPSTAQVMHPSGFLMFFIQRMPNHGQEFIIFNRLL